MVKVEGATSEQSKEDVGPGTGGKFAKTASPIGLLILFILAVVFALVFVACLGLKCFGIFVAVLVAICLFIKLCGASDDQSPLSIFAIIANYRNIDFDGFLKSHNKAYLDGEKTGNYVPGVCNYYELMSGIITVTSGPFWHFVPMTKGLNRKACHDKFHHTAAEALDAKATDKILEFGCGYGEIGRQVAKISGASVTGLTMADAEIAGGNERIEKAGLQDRCKMVQGNYHQMPFDACSFDKVFGIYTLKYSADLGTAISEAARVLKPGGRFLSYEIIVTDKFDPSNKTHKELVHNISYSTCMPPLHHAQEFRDAAKNAGLVLKEEVDLCAPPTEDPWYSCFEKTRVYDFLTFQGLYKLMRFSEAIYVMPKSFTEFFQTCVMHPTMDFVDTGRLGIVDGAVLMVWEKP
mmetsp:Transcript_21330/g.40831  ORF Transcript_21330/g.40831 Transcript_21330/m.40831 type:complete len:407 (+) Transcript_21330:56-1276(+)